MNAARGRRCLGTGEGGFTLTEVLAALVLLGLAVTAIVVAMGNSIILSDVHRRSVTADSIVRSYAEKLTASTDWADCATPSFAPYQPGFLQVDLPAGYHAAITDIQYWNGDSPATFDATCPPDNGLQRITLRAWRGNDLDAQQLEIVKRRPT
jgi:prepilin-type N-terminal cleavage/methylation domain-containing protein